jgi:hypothetical protein
LYRGFLAQASATRRTEGQLLCSLQLIAEEDVATTKIRSIAPTKMKKCIIDIDSVGLYNILPVRGLRVRNPVINFAIHNHVDGKYASAQTNKVKVHNGSNVTVLQTKRLVVEVRVQEPSASPSLHMLTLTLTCRFQRRSTLLHI